MEEKTNGANPSPEMSEQELTELLQIRRDKLSALREAGKDPYTITKYDVTAHNRDIREKFDEMENQTVRVAGRMMSRRIMAKPASWTCGTARPYAGIRPPGRRGRRRVHGF